MYSTCSLNPIEDEAVVSSVFGMLEDITALSIMPIHLQGIQMRHGLNHWNILIPKDNHQDKDNHKDYYH